MRDAGERNVSGTRNDVRSLESTGIDPGRIPVPANATSDSCEYGICLLVDAGGTVRFAACRAISRDRISVYRVLSDFEITGRTERRATGDIEPCVDACDLHRVCQSALT